MKPILILLVSLVVSACSFSSTTPLDQYLDELNVAHHWTAGHHVDWRSGDPDGLPVPKAGHHTHCSAFAASACDRLGIYLLRPPEHSQTFLASAQYDWLKSKKGRAAGWTELNNSYDAQIAANSNQLVIAVWKSPLPHQPGHITVVRPGHKTVETLQQEGPDIIQAGRTNYNRTSLKVGFKHHLGAWDKQQIKFFAHPICKAIHEQDVSDF